MTAADFILEQLRQLWPCTASYLEHELQIQKARGVLEEDEVKAVGQVGSLLRYWEREGRAMEVDGKWQWLPEKRPVQEVQRGLFFQEVQRGLF